MSDVVKVLTSALVEEARKHGKATAHIKYMTEASYERDRRRERAEAQADVWQGEANRIKLQADETDRLLVIARQQAQHNAEDAEKLKAEVDRLKRLNDKLVYTLKLLEPAILPGSHAVKFNRDILTGVVPDVYDLLFGKDGADAARAETARRFKLRN
jgi:hypothetical protein